MGFQGFIAAGTELGRSREGLGDCGVLLGFVLRANNAWQWLMNASAAAHQLMDPSAAAHHSGDDEQG